MLLIATNVLDVCGTYYFYVVLIKFHVFLISNLCLEWSNKMAQKIDRLSLEMDTEKYLTSFSLCLVG